MSQVPIEGDLSEADHDADARKRLDLSREMDGAVANLSWLGLVAGRGAADDGGYPGVAKPEPVVAVKSAGFAGQAEFVQDGVHEVAGAVTSEGAAGTVRAMGARRETQDEDAGAWIAEAGNGTSPVGLVKIGAAFRFSDSLTVFTETRAKVAGNDRFANLLQERGRKLLIGACHCIQ